MRRDLCEPDHEAFRGAVKAYVKREVVPNQQRWEQERNVGRLSQLSLLPRACDGAGVHVSNILRKLGVTSRLQAANAAHSHHTPNT